MMESSEQCLFDSSQMDDPFCVSDTVMSSYDDDARMVNESPNFELNREPIAYLNAEDCSLLHQPTFSIIGRNHLLSDEVTKSDDIVVFLNTENDPSIACTWARPVPLNSLKKSRDFQSDNLEAGSSQASQGNERPGLQTNDKNVNLDNYSSEALDYHIQDEPTTEMVFIPTSSYPIFVGGDKLFHFNDITDPTIITSKLFERGISFAHQMDSELDEGKAFDLPHPISITLELGEKGEVEHSCKVDEEFVINPKHDSKVDEDNSVNKNNDNSLPSVHLGSEIGVPFSTLEDSSSMLSMPSQDINNTVSEINATTSTHVHNQNCRTKNVLESQTEAKHPQHSALPAISPNVNCLEYSNLKETMDSKLLNQLQIQSYTEESSNHSDLKDGTEYINKEGGNSESSVTVQVSVDEDNNDVSKQGDSINFNNKESNSLVNVGQSENVGNQISCPYSKNCENEIDFTDSEKAFLDIQMSLEKSFLSIEVNSKSKHFFSNQSKDHDQELTLTSLDRPFHIMSYATCSDFDVIDIGESVDFGVEGDTEHFTYSSIFDSELDENLDNCENSDPCDKEKCTSSQMLKCTNLKFFENKQNSVSVEGNDKDKKSAENIPGGKSVDIDSEKNNDFVETTVKPCLRTYIRKRKICDWVSKIELFSLDEESWYNQKEEVMDDEWSLFDEAECIDLTPSVLKIKTSLKQSPDLIEDVANPIVSEDLVSTFCDVNIDNKSKENDSMVSVIGDLDSSVLTPEFTYARQKEIPNFNRKREFLSSVDLSLKKAVQTPSCKRISSKTDDSKSGHLCVEAIKNLPKEMTHASSNKRKIIKKGKHVRIFKNCKSLSISRSQNKKGRSDCSDIITLSSFSRNEKIKCSKRLCNDSLVEKCKSVVYSCWNCTFITTHVNNLLVHLKYCALKHI